MSSAKTDIIIIRGAPGSGKSLTAKCLAEFYPNGVRIEIDNLRSMVISVDWTNQSEHINILNLSTGLVVDFLKIGFSPVIIIDTFSGDKVSSYLDTLKQLDEGISVRVFGLFAKADELIRRIDSRKESEFKDLTICLKLNEDVLKFKSSDEYQIDTTGLLPTETAKIIFEQIK